MGSPNKNQLGIYQILVQRVKITQNSWSCFGNRCNDCRLIDIRRRIPQRTILYEEREVSLFPSPGGKAIYRGVMEDWRCWFVCIGAVDLQVL